jgi:glycolate oxidase
LWLILEVSVLSDKILQKIRECVGADNVMVSPEDMAVYSYDATALLRQTPDAVVKAASVEQISALVKLANQEGFPIVPRGSGTGLSGGSIPVEGCVVLQTPKMNRILEIDPLNLTAMVEPGVITADLHQAVEAKGLFYPPDPSSMKICTIGGNVAENSGGLRGLKYGVTRDYILGLEVVLPTGEVLWTGGKNSKDVAGYNLRQLFVGSEGTLGIFTRVLLKLLPKPQTKKTLTAFFPKESQAMEAAAAIIAHPIIPATLEFLDQTTLRCVEDYAKLGLPRDAEAMILVETDGHAAVVEEEAQIVARIFQKHGASSIQVSKTPEDGARLFSARRAAFPALARLKPTTLLEDVSVPRSELPKMLEAIHKIRSRYGILIGTFGHAGDGNLHPTLLLDERVPEELNQMKKAFGEVLEAAMALGGSITGEHGVGLLKKDFLPKLAGAAGIETMKKFKASMDPNNVLNPGKIFSTAPRCEGRLPLNKDQMNKALEQAFF